MWVPSRCSDPGNGNAKAPSISEILQIPRNAAGEERGKKSRHESEGQVAAALLDDIQAGRSATVQHLFHILRDPVGVPHGLFGHQAGRRWLCHPREVLRGDYLLPHLQPVRHAGQLDHLLGHLGKCLDGIDWVWFNGRDAPLCSPSPIIWSISCCCVPCLSRCSCFVGTIRRAWTG